MIGADTLRPCTCDPSEAFVPCQQKFAHSECELSFLRSEVDRLTKERDNLPFLSKELVDSFLISKQALEERAQLAEQQLETEIQLHLITIGERDKAEAALAEMRKIDFLGCALQLENQAKRAESQTVERAMVCAITALNNSHRVLIETTKKGRLNE